MEGTLISLVPVDRREQIRDPQNRLFNRLARYRLPAGFFLGVGWGRCWPVREICERETQRVIEQLHYLVGGLIVASLQYGPQQGHPHLHLWSACPVPATLLASLFAAATGWTLALQGWADPYVWAKAARSPEAAIRYTLRQDATTIVEPTTGDTGHGVQYDLPAPAPPLFSVSDANDNKEPLCPRQAVALNPPRDLGRRQPTGRTGQTPGATAHLVGDHRLSQPGPERAEGVAITVDKEPCWYARQAIVARGLAPGLARRPRPGHSSDELGSVRRPGRTLRHHRGLHG